MLGGISRYSSHTYSYKANGTAMPANQFNFQNRLIDAAINSNNSLNGKHATIYMNCLVSQVSGSGQELHMKYDESSTEENPVIYAWGKDSSGKDFETRIFVNDINPYHASPAEMKALHAHLAQQEGSVKSNSIPIDVSMNGYDVNQRIDFVQYLGEWNAMQELAKNPGADLERLQLEQYLSFHQHNQTSRETAAQYQETLERELLFRSRNPMESRIEKKEESVLFEDERKNGLSLVGINVPDAVQEAWEKAEKEAGINGSALGADGKLSHITQLFAMSLVKFYQEGNADILGSTKDSARAAVQKALELLGIPQTEAQKKEKLFYEAFLRYL